MSLAVWRTGAISGTAPAGHVPVRCGRRIDHLVGLEFVPQKHGLSQDNMGLFYRAVRIPNLPGLSVLVDKTSVSSANFPPLAVKCI